MNTSLKRRVVAPLDQAEDMVSGFVDEQLNKTVLV